MSAAAVSDDGGDVMPVRDAIFDLAMVEPGEPERVQKRDGFVLPALGTSGGASGEICAPASLM
jgi:hypothetical protein